jgi:multidrug efflux pump subunit AcrA (membrane-fusion protein)
MSPSVREHIYRYDQKSRVRYWFWGILFVLLLCLFLPWTQNIRSKGKVTTLRPEQRPQEINTIIGGRIVNWRVREGDRVKKGDTLLQLTEVKESYLDPQLVQRTGEQLDAKQRSVGLYQSKADAAALRNAAVVYRDDLLSSLDTNREIFEDLKKRITDLRSHWFDQANSHLQESETAVHDLMARFSEGRTTVAGTFAEFPTEITANEKSEDN